MYRSLVFKAPTGSKSFMSVMNSNRCNYPFLRKLQIPHEQDMNDICPNPYSKPCFGSFSSFVKALKYFFFPKTATYCISSAVAGSWRLSNPSKVIALSFPLQHLEQGFQNQPASQPVRPPERSCQTENIFQQFPAELN